MPPTGSTSAAVDAPGNLRGGRIRRARPPPGRSGAGSRGCPPGPRRPPAPDPRRARRRPRRPGARHRVRRPSGTRARRAPPRPDPGGPSPVPAPRCRAAPSSPGTRGPCRARWRARAQGALQVGAQSLQVQPPRGLRPGPRRAVRPAHRPALRCAPRCAVRPALRHGHSPSVRRPRRRRPSTDQASAKRRPSPD